MPVSVKLELTNEELIVLTKTLEELGKLKENRVFAFWVASNLAVLRPKVKLYAESAQLPAELVEFEEKRVATCVRFATKDASGNPVLINEQYVIEGAARPQFEKAIEAISVPVKDIQLKYNKDVQELLATKVQVSLQTISFSKIPESIPGNLLVPVHALIVTGAEDV